ncbi:MAG: YggT family protein [Alteromonadaceae bacterium]|nr:MAG: YggT family protein [Alteromonadaceae bacterium]
MNPFVSTLIYVIDTLGGLFLLFVILRFLLQLARADFYNPLSQAIVKVTNPLIIPLRKVIPGVFGVDLAAVVLALVVQMLIGELIGFISIQELINPLPLLLFSVLGTIKVVTYIGIACIVVLVISSFVAPNSSHPIITLSRQLLDPIIRPVQRVIPPMGGLDFSVLFVGLGINVLQQLINATRITIDSQGIAALVIGF